MNNFDFLDFTRNKYFYGKLLSVEDFVTEQEYFNNKRRTINRFLFGCGVITGFNIEQNPDYSCYVTKGLALDNLGREIYLDRDYRVALDALYAEHASKGEMAGKSSHMMYLCVSYAETFAKPVYSLSEGLEAGKSPNYGRCVEGCSFSLTDAPPPENSFVSAILKDEYVIYEDNCLCVRFFVPRYVNPHDEFKILLDFELYSTAVGYDFWCDLDLKGASYKNGEKIHFEVYGQKNSAIHEIILKAGTGRKLEISGRDFNLKIGNSTRYPHKLQAEAKIIVGSLEEALYNDYTALNPDDILAEDGGTSGLVYLARVFVTEERGRVSFGEIQRLSDRRNVYGTGMTYLESRNRRYRVGTANTEPHPVDPLPPTPVPAVKSIKSGFIFIEIDKNNKAGDLFYSKETPHGLGYGNVCVSVGRQDGDCLIFSGNDIFVENIQILTGVKVNVKTGSFVIGIKLLRETQVKSLRLSWFAYRDGTAPTPGPSSLQIIPAKTDVFVRGTFRFELAYPMDIQGKDCTWSINSPTGGAVDQTGVFTASSNPGVYIIKAKSNSNRLYEAQAYVIVKDRL